MSQAYSLDLRERVVAAVEKGGLSARQAATQFGVGASTAIRWVGRLRKTGSIRPGKIGGYKPRASAGEHRAWLLQRIREKDFTLRGLVAELAVRGLKVDYSCRTRSAICSSARSGDHRTRCVGFMPISVIRPEAGRSRVG
jgi:putative transposase